MSLSAPGLVIARLEAIEADLAERQNHLEDAAMTWFRTKRDKERARAEAFLTASGTVAERNAIADKATALMGVEAEAKYEAVKAVMRVLEARASIGQSILRTQSREALSTNGAVQPAWSQTGR
jgi:hypothetical protein